MKKIIRTEMKAKRNAMTQEEVTRHSETIIENIKHRFPLADYKTFAFYMPFNNEADLRPLMEELLKNGKTVVLPKVLNKIGMEFFPVASLTDTSLSRFNILEPLSNEKTPKNDIDIMFIPGVAFSKDCYRLGYGGGYYDRYLAGFNHRKVGIAFSFQVIDSFPTEYYDIPMDEVITENP